MFKRNLKPSLRTILIVIGLLLVSALMLSRLASAAEPDINNPVGLADKTYTDAARSRELNAYVWYPTDAIGLVEMHADNLAFSGFSAIQNAPLEAGNYPLIILSHGSGGNRANQGWMATELARQGAIVVAANHLGSTSRDSAPATNILTWNRPEDVSFLIDQLLSDPTLSPHIDQSRIAVVGHSLGGYTALAVGGAVLSLDGFIAYCADYPNSPDCLFYAGSGVDLTSVDRTKFEQNNRDERVSAIVSIDPAYARSFQPDSLQDMAATLLIAPPISEGGLGDLQVGYLAEQLALGDDYVVMAGAHHFTYLPECKGFGRYFLGYLEADGELLCWPEEGKTRAEFHAETTNEIVTFLQREEILTK